MGTTTVTITPRHGGFSAMKLLYLFTASHEAMKDRWFLPSLQDDMELVGYRSDIRGGGAYKDQDWQDAVTFKSQCIIRTIQENMGDIFVYSDVDIEFFRPFKAQVLTAIQGKDIVGQLDDGKGSFCTGFFGIRANPATLKAWQRVLEAIPHMHCDQNSFNRILWAMRELRWGYLPETFFGPGTFNSKLWAPGASFFIPERPVMFHANWTKGIASKITLLERAREIISGGPSSIARNNRQVLMEPSARDGIRNSRALIKEGSRRVEDLRRAFARPSHVRLDASTACQLGCPGCPTAAGSIARVFGTGWLTLSDFQRFVGRQPWIRHVELSNWGEIFLNPELIGILRYAARRHIALSAMNGVNLNHASTTALEALVKYGMRKLSCSIDGASQETYATYRVKGHFDQVIGNIRVINRFKAQYRSQWPHLHWQFVVFGHNEHEIETARALAAELNMKFSLKLSWDDLYGHSFSPVRTPEIIRNASGLGVADRQEYEARFKKSYIADTCHELWLSPQVNFDGRLLGCTLNHWGDFGNVFAEGLSACLSNPAMTRAKNMLLGLEKAEPGLPCSACPVYHARALHHDWINLRELGKKLGVNCRPSLTQAILRPAARLLAPLHSLWLDALRRSRYCDR
jgi:MoaA/NifB/PqqE/SkfB family radical SAM enzyme